MEAHKPSSALFEVYLRLRPGNADNERFLEVEHSDEHAPTTIVVNPPANDTRKRARDEFTFTRVFEEDAGQRDIFDQVGVAQLLQNVLGEPGKQGRDGTLATLGCTGSGKSHTILGTKTQRGLTQLTLDALYQHVEPSLVQADTDERVFNSISASDVAESMIYRASDYLDNVYDNGNVSRLSRAATPALVRDSAPINAIPGAFPTFHDHEKTQNASTRSVYDRLYPDLSQNHPTQFLCKSPSQPNHESHFSRFTRTIAKLTHTNQECSFMSIPSKRNAPRFSELPEYPSVDDVSINADPEAEYAVVLSMYEVHNDRIHDLLTTNSMLGKQKRKAHLFKNTENSPDRKVVAGLRKVVCSTFAEALLVLETGLLERRTSGTGSNATSSRSHGFFCFEVKKRLHGQGAPGPWSSSTMTIVDLAGSERARTAKTAGATLAEGGKINESLMYLGRCMQMAAENANATTLQLVPFRQCKLTELLFSNSFTASSSGHRTPQKMAMIVTADPLGDFNATSQILRYSALARRAINIRTPSNTSAILTGAAPATSRNAQPTGRATPSALLQDYEEAVAELTRLREDLELTQLRLEEETQRRMEAEASWANSETRIDEMEAEIREEVFEEMEARMLHEQRRWRAARDEELDRQDEHLDRKLEIMARGIEIYEDDDDDQENMDPSSTAGTASTPMETLAQRVSSLALRGQGRKVSGKENPRVFELEDENARLRAQLQNMERERGLRSPSKKMRVLKTRRWEGDGMGLGDDV